MVSFTKEERYASLAIVRSSRGDCSRKLFGGLIKVLWASNKLDVALRVASNEH